MKDTIMDYVNWRGDLSFLEYPYNQVDYLILSNLSYVHFDDVIDYYLQEPISLKDAFILYQQRNEKLEEEQLKPIYNESHYLFEKVSQCPRYQNIKILSYVNELDDELIKQFSAITFLLEEQMIFIAYRGTDDSLLGWHEDFLMLCEKIIPSQLSSVGYLKHMSSYSYHDSLIQSLRNKNLGSFLKRLQKHFKLKKDGFPILLGGHSKGGNLAMYAGCFIDSKIQKRIVKIYNFDGPGFQDEIMLSSEYQRMLPRIISYIPHYSFFGIVLGHEETYKVVQSQMIGMNQHNSFSWTVTPHGFIEDELSYESVQFAIKVILFLEKLSYEEKKVFVETMFGLFYSLDLYTFSDLSHISYKQIIGGIKEMTLLDNSVRKMLIEVLHMLWLEAKKIKKQS